MQETAESPSLLGFLNGEARAAAELAPHVTRATLRRLFLAALAGRFEFPLRASVRGLVTGERDLDGRYLEVVPEGLSPAASRYLGPLLVPLDRPLEAGSVVRVEVELQDPASYEVQPAGLLCRLVGVRVEVAVEP